MSAAVALQSSVPKLSGRSRAYTTAIDDLRAVVEAADREYLRRVEDTMRGLTVPEAALAAAETVQYPDGWEADLARDEIMACWDGYEERNAAILKQVRGSLRGRTSFAAVPVKPAPWRILDAIEAVAERFMIFPRATVAEYVSTRIPPLKRAFDRVHARVITRLLSDTVREGGGVSEMIGALRARGLGTTQFHRETIARTEGNVMFSRGQAVAYRQSPMVSGYRYIAVLDDRTTDICEDLHGMEFSLDDASGVMPPAHYNCRSTTEAILAWDQPSQWDDGEVVREGVSQPLEGFGGVDRTDLLPENSGMSAVADELRQADRAELRDLAADIDRIFAGVSE